MPEPSSHLDAAARQVVLRHVHTFEDLEMLILLSRDANRFWSAAAAAGDLGLAESSAQRALDALASRNLLEVRFGEDVLYRLDRSTPAAAQIVDTILAAVRRQRTAVLEAIASARSAAVDFADAFRLTRKKRDDG